MAYYKGQAIHQCVIRYRRFNRDPLDQTQAIRQGLRRCVKFIMHPLP
jgi:hypothetical protein